MASVTPRTIYNTLRNAGASQNQAIGIMANSVHESGLDPEAIGDNGTSFGFVQQHGASYSTLVTGNPSSDLDAQVNVVATNGGFKAANGATPEQAAGNFAANYEKCQGCQPGGTEYQQRMISAKMVAGWVSSGRFPKKFGVSGTVSGKAPGPGPGCLIAAPQISTPSIPFVGSGSIGGFCLFTKSEARAVIGAVLLAAGAAAGFLAVAFLASQAFKGTPGEKFFKDAAIAAAAVIPGGQAVAAAGVASEAKSRKKKEKEPAGG